MSRRSYHLSLERPSSNLMMTSDDDPARCRTDVSDSSGQRRPSLSTTFKLLVRANVCKVIVKTICCCVKDLHTNLSSCSVWRVNGWPLSLAQRDSAVTQVDVRAFLVASSLYFFLQRENLRMPLIGRHAYSWHT